MNQNPPNRPASPMTATAAARIQSAGARAHGGQTPSGSVASRAQSAAARHGGAPQARAGGRKGR